MVAKWMMNVSWGLPVLCLWRLAWISGLVEQSFIENSVFSSPWFLLFLPFCFNGLLPLDSFKAKGLAWGSFHFPADPCTLNLMSKTPFSPLKPFKPFRYKSATSHLFFCLLVDFCDSTRFSSQGIVCRTTGLLVVFSEDELKRRDFYPLICKQKAPQFTRKPWSCTEEPGAMKELFTEHEYNLWRVGETFAVLRLKFLGLKCQKQICILVINWYNVVYTLFFFWWGRRCLFIFSRATGNISGRKKKAEIFLDGLVGSKDTRHPCGLQA